MNDVVVRNYVDHELKMAAWTALRRHPRSAFDSTRPVRAGPSCGHREPQCTRPPPPPPMLSVYLNKSVSGERAWQQPLNAPFKNSVSGTWG